MGHSKTEQDWKKLKNILLPSARAPSGLTWCNVISFAFLCHLKSYSFESRYKTFDVNPKFLHITGIYADGPGAYLFHGVVEQQYIFHVMNHALCLSDTTQDTCEQYPGRRRTEA